MSSQRRRVPHVGGVRMTARGIAERLVAKYGAVRAGMFAGMRRDYYGRILNASDTPRVTTYCSVRWALWGAVLVAIVRPDAPR